MRSNPQPQVHKTNLEQPNSSLASDPDHERPFANKSIVGCSRAADSVKAVCVGQAGAQLPHSKAGMTLRGSAQEANATEKNEEERTARNGCATGMPA